MRLLGVDARVINCITSLLSDSEIPRHRTAVFSDSIKTKLESNVLHDTNLWRVWPLEALWIHYFTSVTSLGSGTELCTFKGTSWKADWVGTGSYQLALNQYVPNLVVMTSCSNITLVKVARPSSQVKPWTHRNPNAFYAHLKWIFEDFRTVKVDI